VTAVYTSVRQLKRESRELGGEGTTACGASIRPATCQHAAPQAVPPHVRTVPSCRTRVTMPRRTIDRPLDDDSQRALALLAENSGGCGRAVMRRMASRSRYSTD
jgi:hypothetical protein